MKEFLNYYYYLLPDKIRKVGQTYFFKIHNYYFGFYPYNGNIEELPSLLSLNNYMGYQFDRINKIILNREGYIITQKENNFYILVLLKTISKESISLKDIIDFPRLEISFPLLNRTNWYSLWSQKIDHLEQIRNHLKKEKTLIYNSLPYYIGLAENAISYLKYSNLENHHLAICHKRVKAEESLMEFYNPLFLIIDYKVRDLAEYYKSLFFDTKWDIKEIINSIKRVKMNPVDTIYFYIRMLYPSYYFDKVDEILKGALQEKEILKITEYAEDYEYLLYELYLLFKSKVNIVGVEWITKKFAN